MSVGVGLQVRDLLRHYDVFVTFMVCEMLIKNRTHSSINTKTHHSLPILLYIAALITSNHSALPPVTVPTDEKAIASGGGAT